MARANIITSGNTSQLGVGQNKIRSPNNNHILLLVSKITGADNTDQGMSIKSLCIIKYKLDRTGPFHLHNNISMSPVFCTKCGYLLNIFFFYFLQ